MKHLYNSILKITFLITIIILIYGCHDSKPPTEPENPTEINLIKKDSILFSVNHFVPYVTIKGQVSNGQVLYNVNDSRGLLFNSGLWLGAYQNGEARSNSLGVSSFSNGSNYNSNWKDSIVGVYLASKNAITNPNIKWPEEYGAPVDVNGKPMLYGDEMCFTALHSDTTLASNPFSSPIKNIRVAQSVFGYKRVDLEYVLFVKYDIKNLSDIPINEMYAGYWADIDISGNQDLVAYDTESAFTYTYREFDDENGKYNLIGYTFLQSPLNNEHFGVGSHRIMKKDLDDKYGERTKGGEISSQQVIYALQGLDNEGKPMINPVTNSETKFAFTGDPLKQTGWIDSARDVRSLISSDSFTLAGNETKTLTLVIIAVQENSLVSAIEKLKQKVNQIRSEPSLWNY